MKKELQALKERLETDNEEPLTETEIKYLEQINTVDDLKNYDRESDILKALSYDAALALGLNKDQAAIIAGDVEVYDPKIIKLLEEAQDAAYNEEQRYHKEFDRMMDDENNDGVHAPKPIDGSLRNKADRLAKQYPLAAMYLRAKAYTCASNHHKYGAGKDAMNLIENGGSIADAKAILDNWTSGLID